MEGLDGLVATAAYQPEPTAAAAARRFVRDTLQTWLISGAATAGHGLVDDAVLLTSELVTNAVVHAGTQVEVTCKLTDGGVEVVVSDGHPARLVPEPPENEHIPAERTSGRGLLLPAALASTWGVTYGQAAKAVWFRIGQEEGSGLERRGEPADGLRGAANTEVPAAPSRGLGAKAKLAAALRKAPVMVDASSASARNGTYRWPMPPFGEPGYDELLATTVEAARVAMSADAAYAMVPDEDGELRLRAAAGSFPSLAVGPAPGGPVPSRPVPGGPVPGGPVPGGTVPGGAAPGGTAPDGAVPGGTVPGGMVPAGAAPAPAAGRGRQSRRAGRGGQSRRAARAALTGQARRAGLAGQARRAGLVGQPGGRPWPGGHAGMSVPSLAAVRAAAGAAPSVLTVPFVVDGRVTGLLAVESATAGRFREDEAGRLQQFADRWGPTLERARLSELERVRRGRISALAQARGLLTGSADTKEILTLAGEAAVPRLVPWCAVLLPAEGAGLRTVYTRHVDEEWSPALTWLLDRAAEAAAGAGPPSRPGWRWSLAVPGLTQAPAGAEVLAAETAWCFPLGTGDGAGVLVVGHRLDERLPKEVAELAADLACRIGLALDSARLVSQQR